MKKRGRIIFLNLIALICIILFVIETSSSDEFGQNTGTADTSTNEFEIYTPSTIPVETGAIYQEKTDEEEASLDASNVEEPLAISTHTGSLTGDGWGASATYSNAIFDKNGIYQATITGIAAGASYYIISFTGEQIFKYSASEEKSTSRKIVIDAGADTWITVTMAEGDSISSGEAKTNLPYTFTAEEDKATYSFSQGAVTETENGMFAYQGEFREEFDVTNKVETALTTQGFYNITLVGGTK